MRFAVLLAVGPALVLSACGSSGSGGTGDSPSDPSTSKLGDGARLHEIVGEATWLDANDPDSASCDSPPDRHVNVTGVTVVGIDRFDETGQGQLGNFYVQDTAIDAVPFSGITVFAPSFSPPDLRLAEGDVADALGTLMEFLGPSSGRFGECKTLPEIGGTLSFRLENGIREPHTITVDDLKSYESARKWLGMLVRLRRAHRADAANSRADTPPHRPSAAAAGLRVRASQRSRPRERGAAAHPGHGVPVGLRHRHLLLRLQARAALRGRLRAALRDGGGALRASCVAASRAHGAGRSGAGGVRRRGRRPAAAFWAGRGGGGTAGQRPHRGPRRR